MSDRCLIGLLACKRASKCVTSGVAAEALTDGGLGCPLMANGKVCPDVDQ